MRPVNIINRGMSWIYSSSFIDKFYRFHILRKVLPVSVAIEINNNCNLRCVGCARTHHNYKSKNKVMSLQDFKKYFDLFPWNVFSVGLNGFGEPMLHPNIIEIIRHINTKKPRVVIWFSTNLLAGKLETYDKLFDNGLHHLNISVDSLNQKIADKVRTGTDVKILENRLKYMIYHYVDKLNFSIVISKYNFKSFENLTNDLLGIGAKRIVYTLFVPYENNEMELTEEQKQYVYERVNQYDDKVILGRRTDSGFYVKKPCTRLVKGIYIGATGQLLPCCFFWATDLSLGDLNKKELKKIFFSKRWTQTYKQILKGKYPKFCGTFNEPVFCGAMHQ